MDDFLRPAQQIIELIGLLSLIRVANKLLSKELHFQAQIEFSLVEGKPSAKIGRGKATTKASSTVSTSRSQKVASLKLPGRKIAKISAQAI